jgi:hypothetical protein
MVFCIKVVKYIPCLTDDRWVGDENKKSMTVEWDHPVTLQLRIEAVTVSTSDLDFCLLPIA